MIKVRLLIGNARLTGFDISGPAMFAESGSDTVCASVSSAAYMAANTVTEIIGAAAEVSVGEAEMHFLLKEDNEAAFAVLDGLRLHLTELSKQYPKNIKIIYGGVK